MITNSNGSDLVSWEKNEGGKLEYELSRPPVAFVELLGHMLAPVALHAPLTGESHCFA